MDTAVEHCRRGEMPQALAMFRAIREQLDPPPALLKLIAELEAGACVQPAVAANAPWGVRIGGGWDSNVSQGITARTLALGSGPNTIELELDPSFRPRSAAFVQAAADFSVALPRHGLNLQLGLSQRINAGAREFDIRAVSAAASREFALPVGVLRGHLEAMEIWLGNRHYQHGQTAVVQWLLDRTRGATLASLQATSVQYVTQPLQDASVFELGVLNEWRLDPSHTVHAGLSVQRDHARRARPGGDRRGATFTAGAVLIEHGWRLRPQVAYTAWNSRQVFAPGLLDVRRRNRLHQLALQAERPLGAGTSLLLEWRGRWASDTIALYRYQSQSVSAMLAYRF